MHDGSSPYLLLNITTSQPRPFLSSSVGGAMEERDGHGPALSLVHRHVFGLKCLSWRVRASVFCPSICPSGNMLLYIHQHIRSCTVLINAGTAITRIYMFTVQRCPKPCCLPDWLAIHAPLAIVYAHHEVIVGVSPGSRSGHFIVPSATFFLQAVAVPNSDIFVGNKQMSSVNFQYHQKRFVSTVCFKKLKPAYSYCL